MRCWPFCTECCAHYLHYKRIISVTFSSQSGHRHGFYSQKPLKLCGSALRRQPMLFILIFSRCHVILHYTFISYISTRKSELVILPLDLFLFSLLLFLLMHRITDCKHHITFTCCGSTLGLDLSLVLSFSLIPTRPVRELYPRN